MSDTAMVPLRESLASLIETDSELGNFLNGRKVYAATVPVNSSLGYVVVGQIMGDTDASYYQQPGRRHKRRLTAWAQYPWTAEQIMARLIQLLDRRLLTVDGHQMQSAQIDIVAGPVESVDKKAWGLHADWTVTTLAGNL